jgi:hypothetical protein
MNQFKATDLLPAPLVWAMGSVLVYALTENVLWLLRGRNGRLQPYGRWLQQVARFGFYLGIPYLALGGWPNQPFQGLLSPEDIGLVGLGGNWPVSRWLGAVGTGLGLGLVAFLILLVAWITVRRSGPAERLSFSALSWGTILVDGLYLQAHWAFYRSVLTIVWGDVYPGIFAGLGLVYLEWSLNPSWRGDWRHQARAVRNWLHVAMALVTAMVFLFTRNLWVCVVIHWGLELAFWRLGREQARMATSQIRVGVPR